MAFYLLLFQALSLDQTSLTLPPQQQEFLALRTRRSKLRWGMRMQWTSHHNPSKPPWKKSVKRTIIPHLHRKVNLTLMFTLQPLFKWSDFGFKSPKSWVERCCLKISLSYATQFWLLKIEKHFEAATLLCGPFENVVVENLFIWTAWSKMAVWMGGIANLKGKMVDKFAFLQSTPICCFSHPIRYFPQTCYSWIAQGL